MDDQCLRNTRILEYTFFFMRNTWIYLWST